MARDWLQERTGSDWPLVGMVHLRPLPGSPGASDDFAATRAAALADARALVAGGIDALMVENFGDTPFFPDAVPPVTVAAMTRVVAEIRDAVAVPLGVNVLRNDGLAALSIAHAVGAEFIRINVLNGAMVTDQGLVQGRAHEILRLRRALGAQVRVLADVAVKHAAPLVDIPVAQATRDLIERAGADAVLVSGVGTGHAPDRARLEAVAAAAEGHVPLLLGSGLSVGNLPDFQGLATGAVVGTSVKRGGRVGSPVDTERVRRLAEARR